MAVDVAVATRRLFTVEEFHRMGEAGVFAPDERVELIEGEIVAMSPIGARHAARTSRAAAALQRRCGDAVIVWSQNLVRLRDRSEVYPDVALLRYRADHYEAAGGPTTADVLLIVEISDATLRYDLETKAALYAAYGIPEYWVEDIPVDRIVVHRDPTPEGYRTVRSLGRGERLAPLAFPTVELLADELLG